MKKLVFGTLIAVMLLAAVATPVLAAEQSTTASVTVNDVISISLADVNSDGIQFGSVAPGSTYGDVAQDDDPATPAVTVTIEAETNVNVDISIKGTTTSGISIDNWKYSLTFGGEKFPLGDYAEKYTDVGDGTYGFYHWITVPTGTTAGSHSATVWYKAETHS